MSNASAVAHTNATAGHTARRAEGAEGTKAASGVDHVAMQLANDPIEVQLAGNDEFAIYPGAKGQYLSTDGSTWQPFSFANGKRHVASAEGVSRIRATVADGGSWIVWRKDSQGTITGLEGAGVEYEREYAALHPRWALLRGSPDGGFMGAIFDGASAYLAGVADDIAGFWTMIKELFNGELFAKVRGFVDALGQMTVDDLRAMGSALAGAFGELGGKVMQLVEQVDMETLGWVAGYVGLMVVHNIITAGAGGMLTKFTGVMSRFSRAAGKIADLAGEAKTSAKLKKAYGGHGDSPGRPYDASRAGGAVRKLDYSKARITPKGVQGVIDHIEGQNFHSKANTAAIERLKKIANGEMEATDFDLRYYTHELREKIRYKRGASGEDSYEQWENAHGATLADYGLRDLDEINGQSVLYHPDVAPLLDEYP